MGMTLSVIAYYIMYEVPTYLPIIVYVGTYNKIIFVCIIPYYLPIDLT